MPNVTVTIRQLKNVNTGLDLSIPSHSEKPGMLKNSVICHVVAVTNLSTFKSSQHKNTDVVQFMVLRQFEDFENFRRQLMTRFAGTSLPSLPKTLFSLVEGSVKEQVTQLEKFLKFVAATKKLAISPETAEFLGFSSKYMKTEQEKSKKSTLFEEESSEESDLFQNKKVVYDEKDDTDLFQKTSVSGPGAHEKRTTRQQSLKLFEDQDYGGEVFKHDELVTFVGAADKPEMTESLHPDSTEEEEDLLNTIDDRLDSLDVFSKETEKTVVSSASSTNKSAKPGISPKPVTTKAVRDSSTITNTHTRSMECSLPTFDSNDKTSTELAPTDILRYIEENAHQDEEVDLFP